MPNSNKFTKNRQGITLGKIVAHFQKKRNEVILGNLTPEKIVMRVFLAMMKSVKPVTNKHATKAKILAYLNRKKQREVGAIILDDALAENPVRSAKLDKESCLTQGKVEQEAIMLAEETMALVRTLSSKDVLNLEQEGSNSNGAGVSPGGAQIELQLRRKEKWLNV